MKLSVAVLCSIALFTSAANAATRHAPSQQLTASAINAAAPGVKSDATALIVKAEVLLDRQHYSPGAIDGKDGDNFRKALLAFQQAMNLNTSGKIDGDTWHALVGSAAEPVIKSYSISNADLAGPFDRRIPAKLEQMAELHGLSYQSPIAELAKKFHMSEALLHKLNPHARFDRAGEEIEVAGVQPLALRNGRSTVEVAVPKNHEADAPRVDTIVVDKAARDVRAYDKDGKLLAFYPAAIDSTEKPAPTGTFAVNRVAWNPDYHYNPNFAWKGVNARRRLTIRPGPNNRRLTRQCAMLLPHCQPLGSGTFAGFASSRWKPA